MLNLSFPIIELGNKQKMNKVTDKEVAIVIPLSSVETLTDTERISLHHLKTFLGPYDKYFLASDKIGLNHVDLSGFLVQRFPSKFFGSAQAHNRLLTDLSFYLAFRKYKYILIYHLDSLVFSDQLIEWCQKGYDYIAPPWFSSDLDWLDHSAIGNGGFSLRKIDSFIRLYSSNVKWEDPKIMAKKLSKKLTVLGLLLYPLARVLFNFRTFNSIDTHTRRYVTHIKSGEDRFISQYATHYLPEFNFCPIDEALRFAFETTPKKSYKLNGNKLPFGCHAFKRYNYSFWKPFLLKPED